MKIKRIEIARFGVWQQLALSVPSRGVALFYGPNEAGETTLSRFIRGILYGFEPFAVELTDGTSRPVGWEGMLRVEGRGVEYGIRRISDRGTRGLVSVVGTEREQPAESLLAELLEHTDESLFENVFAFGLNELQELATLQADEVAHHIYGLTLGPTGASCSKRPQPSKRKSAAFWTRRHDSGRLADLFERKSRSRKRSPAGKEVARSTPSCAASGNRIQERIESLNETQADVSLQRRDTDCWPGSGRIGTRSAKSAKNSRRFPKSPCFRPTAASVSRSSTRRSPPRPHPAARSLNR